MQNSREKTPITLEVTENKSTNSPNLLLYLAAIIRNRPDEDSDELFGFCTVKLNTNTQVKDERFPPTSSGQSHYSLNQQTKVFGYAPYIGGDQYIFYDGIVSGNTNVTISVFEEDGSVFDPDDSLGYFGVEVTENFSINFLNYHRGAELVSQGKVDGHQFFETKLSGWNGTGDLDYRFHIGFKLRF